MRVESNSARSQLDVDTARDGVVALRDEQFALGTRNSA
jgi:hypothetical protein